MTKIYVSPEYELLKLKLEKLDKYSSKPPRLYFNNKEKVVEHNNLEHKLL